jgi:diguanylate cyclase (GGDEF)-like protein
MSVYCDRGGGVSVATSAQLINSVAATTSIRDRDSLDESIAHLLFQFVGAHSVALFRLVEDGQIKRVVRRASVVRPSSQATDPPAIEVSVPPALASMPAWQECIDRNDIVQCPGPEARTVTLFPITRGRGATGILVIDADEALRVRDAELVRGILRILQNHLSLLDYGELDTLTGLLNRKTFESHFAKLRELLILSAHNAAPRESSWLALFDIDRFKSINDGHGHLVGDEILLLVSQIMKRNFRGADQLFRFGGEEFLVVLDQASDAGALVAIERLRASIEEHAFPQVGRVTMSSGYTRMLPNDCSTTCVERADAALYYAKAHGRNNVRNYETLVTSGELTDRDKSGAVDLF